MSAVSQMLLIGSGANTATRTYVTRVESAVSMATFTFAATSLGTAGANRSIVVGIQGGNATSNRTLDAVTIGGVSATISVSANNTNRRGGIAIAAVPTGTTGDIVVTFSGSQARCVVWVWAVYGLQSTTAVNTASSTASPLAPSVNTSAGGVAFGCAYSNSSGATATWVGLTEDNDAGFDGTSFAAASAETAAASSPLTVTCTWTASSQPVGVSASYR